MQSIPSTGGLVNLFGEIAFRGYVRESRLPSPPIEGSYGIYASALILLITSVNFST